MVGASHIVFALLVAGVLSSKLTEDDIEKLKQYKVIPDIISGIPEEATDVNFGDIEVDMGNELKPSQVQNEPQISWGAEDGALYTLILNDPDIPPGLPGKEFQHWLVVNIPGNDIANGNTVYKFFGSAPPKNSGLHRYTFLVYKQPSKVKRCKYDKIKDEKLTDRLKYTLKELLRRFNLRDPPLAVNFYLAQYEEKQEN